MVGLIRKRTEHRLKLIGTTPAEVDLDKLEEDIPIDMETEDPKEIEFKVAESKINQKISQGFEDF